MSGRVLEARLDAQRRLTSSFDPAESRRGGMTFEEAQERGAIAIYATIVREPDLSAASTKWATKSTESNREARRAEAAACLRAAGWRP